MALVQDSGWRSHIAYELGSEASVVFATDVDQLVEATRQTIPDIVLWHLNHECDFSSIGSAVTMVRRLTLDTPIVAYCRLSPDVARLVGGPHAPALTALLLRGHDNLALALRRILTGHSRRRVIQAVVDSAPSDHAPAHRIWSHCVERSLDVVLTVERLAAELHVNRRTLGYRLRAAHLPAPEALIGWSRVLVAARMLRDPGVSIAAAARLLHFSSVRDCGAMITRYTGCSPGALRAALRLVAVAWEIDGSVHGA
jgi:AraC-like DNA-binding protein